MQNSDQTIDLSRFKQGGKLGEGSFGEVFKVTEISTGIAYAAKISFSTTDKNTRESIINLLREVNLNASMNHPSILQFIGFSPINFQNENKPVIILELSHNGALSDIIDYESRCLAIPGWDNTKKLIMIYGIASGMSYLHSHNLLHRDLKPENVLADDCLFPKISDFGFAKQIHNKSSASLESIHAMKGSPAYLAPEIIENQYYSKAGDVYAFGIIVYEIMMGKRVYEGFTQFKLYQDVMNGNRPDTKYIVPEAYKSLIERCWSQDPKDRPSFDEIVEELQKNEFITDFADEDDFQDYVEFIKESQITFDKNKKILRMEDFIRKSESKSFQKVSLQAIKKVTKRNILPPKFFKDLDPNCRKLVDESKDDPDMQYVVGTYLIEGSNGFPQNVEYGIKYLEESSESGCVDSALYLSDLYTEGKLIPQNIDRAKEYIYEKEDSEDGRIYLKLGEFKKNEGKMDEARKYYEKGSHKYNSDCMFFYGCMLMEGEGGEINTEEGMKFIALSINQGCNESSRYTSISRKMKEIQEFSNLPIDAQHLLIRCYVESSNNEIQITEKYAKIFFDKNFFKLSDFNKVIESFSVVNIELPFPSDLFCNRDEILKAHKNIRLQIYILPNLNSIENFAFSGCSSITQITIPSSVTSIGYYAFGRCSLLTLIAIPSSVTSIGDSAFSGCSLLTQIAIPSSVTSIGESAFYECSSLTQITIPSSVTSIGDSAFSGCSLLTQIAIPSSVTSIGESAFYECSSLTQITIPSSVTSIGRSAFSECSSLTQIAIPSSVTSIGESAFYECSSLTQITIPSSVTSIGRSAFSECSSLTQITIPSSVTSIRNYTFCGCSSLTQITIPSSVTSIGDSAFSGCSSLTQIPIPSSVTSIRNYTFRGCSSLTQIPIPSSVTSIGDSAFSGCSSLTQIPIPSSVTSIGDSAFFGCSSLTQIPIPSSVTSIRNCAFSGCSSLTQIPIPSSVTSIGDSAFSGCSSLTQIPIPSSVTSIGDSAFFGCSSLTQIPIPSSVTSIGDSAFSGCSSLTQITIPSSVTSIGSSAFKGCSSLTQITIPSSVTSIGDYAFSGTSIKPFPIPQTVTHVGENIFSGNKACRIQ